MGYSIYFDESNKLDQPKGDYSYYGALGAPSLTIDKMINEIQEINERIGTKSEMHFVNYTSDTNFEKYFKVLNYVLEQDVKMHLMLVNKQDAKMIADKMSVTIPELRELFYVKIPERLFYGMTRNLTYGEQIQIVIDENSEYEKIDLQTKLAEQMNAHSAYRKKCYKVAAVEQVPSDENIALQVIDVFMGIVVFLLEAQYKKFESENQNVTLMVKNDFIYRFLIHNENLKKLHERIVLYRWGGNEDSVHEVNLSEFTGDFLVQKTQFDIQEMQKLAELRLIHPEEETRFYREKMGYTTRQLRAIQGYIAELDGEGRNSYYLKKD